MIGAGKWLDKAIAGTVSIFVLWPLAVTAGFGAWEQSLQRLLTTATQVVQTKYGNATGTLPGVRTGQSAYGSSRSNGLPCARSNARFTSGGWTV